MEPLPGEEVGSRDGIEFRYQRRDEDAPFIVHYEATIQFPDPGDTD